MKRLLQKNFYLFLALSFLVITACAQQKSVEEKISPQDIELSQGEFKKLRAEQSKNIDDEITSLDKLLPVAFNILEANMDLCGVDRSVISYGFFTDASQFIANNGIPVQPLTSSLPFYAPIEIAYVVSSGPASGLLKRHDKIVGFNTTELKGNITENYVQLAKEIAAFPLDTATFHIERNGQLMSVNVKPVKVCNYPVYLNENNAVSSHSDGTIIYINSSVLNIADTPDKIALIIGHEMTHNRMNHKGKRQGGIIFDTAIGTGIGVLTGIPFAGLAVSRIGRGEYKGSQEEEADYFGTYYAARAGYDVSQAFPVWKELSIKNPKLVHMEKETAKLTAKRFLILKRAAAEINRKLQTGEPLEPSADMMKRTKNSIFRIPFID